MSVDGLYLVVRIAGERVALPGAGIDAVIECDAVTPVPGAAGQVLGLTALRGRVVTLLGAAAALGLSGVPALGEAVLLTRDGHAYALVVDAVEDVIVASAPAPPPVGLSPEWARVASGIVEAGTPLLVLDPDRLLAPSAARATA